MAKDNVKLQAEEHPLVRTDSFDSKEEYVLHLMHFKAYEQVASLAEGKTVLDLGCNRGYGSHIISKTAESVVGVDVSLAAVQAARSSYGAEGIEFQLVDGQALPFDDNCFDILTSFQVIEHIDDYSPYLTEIIRTLKPAGRVVFTTPNALVRLEPGMKPWNRFHVREFSPQELQSLLETYFDDVQIFGLKADSEIYEIEYKRVQKLLARAKRRQAKSPFRRGFKNFREKLKTVMKNILPGQLQSVISMKKSSSKKVTPSGLDVEFQQRYSTKNFYYLENDLEDSLDLMAVCQSRLTISPAAR